MKSEATYTANLHKSLNDSQQKCVKQEDKLKEAKSKLRNGSKLFHKDARKSWPKRRTTHKT